MFDLIQISWWFLQTSLLGYLCNYRLLSNDTERLLLAPATGLAALLIVGNFLWMWNFPTVVNVFVLHVAVACAVIRIVRNRPTFLRLPVALLVAGVALVAIHGTAIPFEEKLWQGYPIDRFGYLSAHIMFQQESYSYFTEVLARLTYNGERQVFYVHPMLGAAFGEMAARPAAGRAFVSLASLTPNDLHQLGQAWEVFLRTVQFASILALFLKLLGPRAIAGYLALCTIFGYWFQYMKDFNSWPQMATVSLIIGIFVLLASAVQKGALGKGERYLLYLLALAMLIGQAEMGLVLGFGAVVVICLNRILREQLIYRREVVFEVTAFVTTVFLVHPQIFGWVTRTFAASPTIMNGGEFAARGLFRIFGSDSEVLSFIKSINVNPFQLLADPVGLADIAIGTTGFSFLTYVGGLYAFGGGLIVLAYLNGAFDGRHFAINANSTFGDRIFSGAKRRPIMWGLVVAGGSLMVLALLWPGSAEIRTFNILASLLIGSIVIGLLVFAARSNLQPGIKPVLAMSVFFFGFFLVALLAQYWFGILGNGAAFRIFGFWGAFASMSLTLLLASVGIPALTTLTAVLVSLNLIFGGSINWVANRGGMETYPAFYKNATGILHFEVLKVRDRYDFDYLSLVEKLRRCNLVFLDFKDAQSRGIGRFQAANLAMFLDNNQIRFRQGFDYLGGYNLVGPLFAPGYKKEEVNADCIVDQELRNGRYSYRFTNDWR